MVSQLDSHQLMEYYQKIAALHKTEPLGRRKPSELLPPCLNCPQGHKSSNFYTHLFLDRLPAELRITLGEDNYPNVRALVKKADA